MQPPESGTCLAYRDGTVSDPHRCGHNYLAYPGLRVGAKSLATDLLRSHPPTTAETRYV
jgi:hypothetical protein